MTGAPLPPTGRGRFRDGGEQSPAMRFASALVVAAFVVIVILLAALGAVGILWAIFRVWEAMALR